MIASFIAAAILIELTPGPNMTWLAALAATRGRAKALQAVAGIALGLAIAAAVAAVGLTALFYEFPALYAVLRWAGTLYLFYLAWDAWQEPGGQSWFRGSSKFLEFRLALASNLLNPKAYLFYAAVLPRFIDDQLNLLPQVALLSAIYVAVASVIHTGIALAAGSLEHWLHGTTRAVYFRKAMALLIAATAFWFFYSTGQMK